MHHDVGSTHTPLLYHGGGYGGDGYGGGYCGGGGGYGAINPAPHGLGMYSYNHPPTCLVLKAPPPPYYHEWGGPVQSSMY